MSNQQPMSVPELIIFICDNPKYKVYTILTETLTDEEVIFEEASYPTQLEAIRYLCTLPCLKSGNHLTKYNIEKNGKELIFSFKTINQYHENSN